MVALAVVIVEVILAVVVMVVEEYVKVGEVILFRCHQYD